MASRVQNVATDQSTQGNRLHEAAGSIGAMESRLQQVASQTAETTSAMKQLEARARTSNCSMALVVFRSLRRHLLQTRLHSPNRASRLMQPISLSGLVGGDVLHSGSHCVQLRTKLSALGA